MKVALKGVVSLFITLCFLFMGINVPVKADCCTYTVTRAQSSVTGLMKGKTHTFTCYVKNTCTINSTITFTFTDKVNVSIATASLSVGNGLTKSFQVIARMPDNATTNSNVTFSFNVKPNCSINIKSVSFTLTALPTCSFTLTKNNTPATMTGLEANKNYSYTYTLKNTSTENVTFTATKIANIDTISGLPSTLTRYDTRQVTVRFIMPANTRPDTDITFSFKITTNCQTSQTFSFTIKCIPPCCNFKVTQTTPAITKLEKGKSYTYSYTVKNECTESRSFSFDLKQNIVSINPSSFTLGGTTSQVIQVVFKMPSNAVANSSVTFKFWTIISCNKYINTEFSLKATSPCCDFSVTQTTTSITTLGKGYTYSYSYTVKNNCTESRLFTTTAQSHIVSITPSSFTLAGGASQVIVVKFMMPTSVNVGSDVQFSFMVNADCGITQTGNQKQITFYVKAINLCCTYTVTRNSTPSAIQYLTIGKSYTYNFTIKNTCTASGDRITFTLSNVAYVNTCTPSTFTLGPGETKVVQVSFTMPNVAPNTMVSFKFKVVASCDNEPKITSFGVKATRST